MNRRTFLKGSCLTVVCGKLPSAQAKQPTRKHCHPHNDPLNTPPHEQDVQEFALDVPENIWFRVPVVIHTATLRKFDADAVDKLMGRLDAPFKDTGIQFELQDVVRHKKEKQWLDADYNYCNKYIKPTLNKAFTPDTCLNVLVLTGFQDYAGFSTFPWGLESAPEQDGIVLSRQYGIDDTFAHEVGHWCGLYHTFQKPTDFVDDTPEDFTQTFDCVGPNSGNLMSYSHCRVGFTTGQVQRLRQQMLLFRDTFAVGG